MNYNNSLVSIIIPAYNVKKYLNECLESVVQQSYRNIEIILVNDGSTDESGAICDVWAKKDKRITVIHKKNEGLNFARKDGFEKSTGEYVTFLDSDDLFHKDNIKNSLQALVDNKADVSIYAFKEFSDLDTKDGIILAETNYEVREFDTKNQIVNYAFFGDNNFPNIQYMTVWGKLYKRKTVQSVDWTIANYRIYEDNFWTPQALLNSDKVILMSTPLVYYRRNADYGASGVNLGNKMTDNSINGNKIGYLELVELIRKFYLKLARDYGFETRLDNKINKQAFLSKTWRIDNLAKAGLLDSENNMKYVSQTLPKYIEAKNKHIHNLSVDIDNLKQSLQEANDNLIKLRDDVERLNKKLEDFSGIRSAVKLLLTNIRNRLTGRKN